MKLKIVESEKGDLHEIIPRLVNQKGQRQAGIELGLSAATINSWLKRNGYIKKIQYIRSQEWEGEKAS